jgi:hypothetical protein
MRTVYISSTREDLEEHRQEVAETLRASGFQVEGMEKYPARDDTPRTASQSDAAKCDIYLGIFAWRYGYVPEENNPEAKSITELEYSAAGRAEKPRLIFLLADDAPWPSSRRDAETEKDEGKRIRDLRNRLRTERWTGFFRSPDDLAKQVLISINQLESTKPVVDTEAIENVQSAAEFGPSFLPNLQQQIDQLRSAEFITLRLGPKLWWNTRLHLAAALASDFTEIRAFVLVDAQRRFVTMASPVEIRRAFIRSEPRLEMAYLQSRVQGQAMTWLQSELDRIIASYALAAQNVFEGRPETEVKQTVTSSSLRELGIRAEGEVIEQFGGDRRPLVHSDVLRRRSPYLVLMREGEIEGVIDRAELASRQALSRESERPRASAVN